MCERNPSFPAVSLRLIASYQSHHFRGVNLLQTAHTTGNRRKQTLTITIKQHNTRGLIKVRGTLVTLSVCLCLESPPVIVGGLHYTLPRRKYQK